ncbi:3466_t:CDS:2 [Funneliformis caledonium]|uniref:3466_t:CDS:1 n=1 Tax=Funneliformis caledonium TaxID=1117310 RepID=A0A9N8Z9H3_9GLOM|nr:3466_t:CDS:2 [Funneliformis caledonium]
MASTIEIVVRSHCLDFLLVKGEDGIGSTSSRNFIHTVEVDASEVLVVEAEPEVGIRLGSTAGLTGLKNGLSSKITASYLEEISFKTDKKTERLLKQ